MTRDDWIDAAVATASVYVMIFLLVWIGASL